MLKRARRGRGGRRRRAGRVVSVAGAVTVSALLLGVAGAARTALLAYAQGVNDDIAAVRASGDWPALFTLTGQYPRAWTPVDSLVIQGVLTQELDYTTGPLDYALLRKSLGAARTADWFPVLAKNAQAPYDPGPYVKAPLTPVAPDVASSVPQDGSAGPATVSAAVSAGPPASTPASAGTSPAAVPAAASVQGNGGAGGAGTRSDSSPAVTEAIASVLDQLSQLPPNQVHHYPDSNAWAANGPAVAGGGALLGGDPHLPQTLPSIWYEVTLSAPGYQAAGVTVPGFPGILLGHNDHIAWSLTDTQNSAVIPDAAVPQSYDPPSHVIATGNQRPVSGDYPYYVGTAFDFYDPGYRAAHAYRELRAAEPLTTSSVARLQNDLADPLAARVRPAVLSALSAAGLSGPDQQAVTLLRSWNGQMDAGSAAASLWWTFWGSYLNVVFAPWWQAAKVPVSEDRDALGVSTGSAPLNEDLEAWTLGDQSNAAFAGPSGHGPGTAPASLRLRAAVLVTAAAACAVGAWLGAWWVPFVTGLSAGALGPGAFWAGFRGAGGPRPRRGLVLTAAAGAVLGWLLVLWLLALDGQPAGATARTVAALAGLPPYAWLTVTVVALLAVFQALAGAWLARAVIPRRR